MATARLSVPSETSVGVEEVVAIGGLFEAMERLRLVNGSAVEVAIAAGLLCVHFTTGNEGADSVQDQTGSRAKHLGIASQARRAPSASTLPTGLFVIVFFVSIIVPT